MSRVVTWVGMIITLALAYALDRGMWQLREEVSLFNVGPYIPELATVLANLLLASALSALLWYLLAKRATNNVDAVIFIAMGTLLTIFPAVPLLQTEASIFLRPFWSALRYSVLTDSRFGYTSALIIGMGILALVAKHDRSS